MFSVTTLCHRITDRVVKATSLWAVWMRSNGKLTREAEFHLLMIDGFKKSADA